MNPGDPQEALWALLTGGAIALAINLLLVLVWGVRRLVWKKPTFAPVWSLVDVWAGAQIALILLVLLSGLLMPTLFLVSQVVPALHLPCDGAEGLLFWLLPLAIVQNVVFFAVPAGFIVWKYGRRLRDIGLPPRPRPQDLWAGIVLGAILLLLSGGMEAGLHALAEQFRQVEWVDAALRYEKSNPAVQILRSLSKQGIGTLILAVVTIGIAAPIGEEMLFRGFLFNALKRRLGLAAGLILSALLFAVVHMYVLALLPVFLIGLVLAWVYHNSGSLWISILLHATNNTAAVLLAYLFPSTVR